MIDKQKIIGLRENLLAWGETNIKTYPWRQTQDPYKILVAEFMLHRTQVVQAEVIYKRFVSLFPTLEIFSQASPDDVWSVLHPLGLHWRIEGMRNALVYLWENYRSVPTQIDKLISVPGIGPYIAGATVCFSQNQPLALIDTNTVRVTGRVFGLDLKGEARRKKQVIDSITVSCDPEQPRRYYYSMIDLAHTICKIKDPFCAECPLLDVPCQFGQQNVV